MDVNPHAFLISTLDGDEWSASRSGYIISGNKAFRILWISAAWAKMGLVKRRILTLSVLQPITALLNVVISI
jgi:hypothetical protein